MKLRSFLAFALLIPTCLFGDENFPEPTNSEQDKSAMPMSPEEAAASFRVPEGFRVSVFAAEPDVLNPIDYAWDSRGRLWIAESFTYEGRPHRFDLSFRDRVTILEDADGDGRCDKRSVFIDTVQQLTSLEVGLGGVWVLCPPQLIFIPDRNRDDRPDGAGEVVLDGFRVPPENHHNFANGLRWGLDGWLYGRCGASSPGLVGKPGTPDAERTPLVGGIWRYHPGRRHFETLCHGTTNPWGHDWNERGEGFFINTVNGHLWHLIPGARFRRPHTIDPNPRVYQPMEMHADHWHWDISKDWSDSRSATGEHDTRGGGHAHVGCTIYLGDNWPASYRDRLMTINMHGRRTNVERLERAGSGYIGRHEPDMLFAADPFYRAVEMTYGPDGTVLIFDWSDTGECHEHTGVHRTSGRIYRVAYGDARSPEVRDLRQLSPASLVDLHKHSNEWFSRFARRELVDRQALGQNISDDVAGLQLLVARANDPVTRLRAIWTLQALGLWSVPQSRQLLEDVDESVRTWGVRLLTDAWPLDTAMGPTSSTLANVDADDLKRLETLAKNDSSGLVRLAVASTLQRLPVKDRLSVAQALWSHRDDRDDPNLPLLVWYGVIPVADAFPNELAMAAWTCEWPLARKFIARRLAEDLENKPAGIAKLLEPIEPKTDPAFVGDFLAGLVDGLRGWRKAPAPIGWQSVAAAFGTSENREIAQSVRDLSVLFGDGRALTEVRQLALDGKADLNDRKAALVTLIAQRPDDLQDICEKLLNTRFLNTVALKGLATIDRPDVGKRLAENYRKFHHSERAAVMETLVSRASFAMGLLDAMEKDQVPRGDLSAFQARQILSFGDDKLSARLGQVWGELRDSPADRRELMTRLRADLSSDMLAQANLSNGRVLFQKNCANCHRLFGTGGGIGPDITGAQRSNLDYLLENIVDPSAVVNRDYRLAVVAMADGRTFNGIVVEQTDRTITLQTATDRVTLDRQEIDEQVASPLSLMPDGMIQKLSPEEIRDLFGYLQSPTQVNWPAGFDPAALPMTTTQSE
ncbi:MAG: c-type cytochrome [Planctomycetaceae bacterium]|nr:c-type cytochrome [Planctomycetaceae bacterium]